MTAEPEAPTPGLAHAFDLMLQRGAPVPVGVVATGGRRSYVPVTGGTFEGEGLKGRVTAGGETLLERSDGVTVVEVSFYIAFAEGVIARCFGTGYRTSGEWFSGTRLSLLFEAAEQSDIAALATRAFVAEQAEGSAHLSISRII